MKRAALAMLRDFNSRFGRALDRRLDSNPLTSGPLADVATYKRMHAEEQAREYEEIDAFEAKAGFSLDRTWFEDLALHTQVTLKPSGVCYQHGRVLYAAIRRYIAQAKVRDVTIVETGTARGFSAICMARALDDAGIDGRIITVDSLPHDKPMYWNCIDDHERAKSRRELLAPWQRLAARVVFLHGRTEEMMPRLNLTRVNVAFLDASHTARDVMFEFNCIVGAQKAGDLMVFDDYTPERFPGVVAAVDRIERDYCSGADRLVAHAERGYACLVRR